MLIGHEQLVEDFKGLAERNELSHGYLFCGPARAGKKLFALSFANFLETGDFEESNMLRDSLLLEPNEEGTVGIDEIRRIRNFLWQKPVVSKKRTVVINDVEAMTVEAQNALLKVAEEPPESSLLILVARDPEKLLPTLQSRLQKIYFSPVHSALIENWLKEKFGKGQEAGAIAKLSSGQPGLAWKMLFDGRFREMRKSGEAFLKSGFWARREMIKTLIEPDDFNLSEFLEILLMILSNKEIPAKINLKLWHKILDLRRNTDHLNLNPRLQLENLLNEV
ncbi:MAG: hypothetical protein HY433_02020 [Candidatus Liptonbacteria bacterium]|nr:hypothetical protein [Candidatus Liptonbacteria bacterium]